MILEPLKEDRGEKVEEFIMKRCNHPELGICDSIWRLREGTVSVSEEGIYIQCISKLMRLKLACYEVCEGCVYLDAKRTLNICRIITHGVFVMFKMQYLIVLYTVTQMKA